LDKKYLLPSFAVTKDLPGLEGSTALDPHKGGARAPSCGWRSIPSFGRSIAKLLLALDPKDVALDPSPLLQHFNFS
jgi:hypothetical protein